MRYTGINLRESLRAARELGCRITVPRRTGEVLVVPPGGRKSVRVCARRKDTPRSLSTLLSQLEKADTSFSRDHAHGTRRS